MKNHLCLKPLVGLILLVFMLPACAATAPAAERAALPEDTTFNLWPGDPPGEPTWEAGKELPPTEEKGGRLAFVHVPTLEVRHARGEGRTGAAVVICPGGGYRILAHGHEGDAVAKWLNANGITAIILRNRIFPYRHPVPMMDVQRALQTVRANADKWQVDPERIGVLGFSAGGHLASTATVHHKAADPGSKDPIERVSSRPSFSVLVYPVVTMREWSHGGSRNNLLGPEPDAELIALLSNEEHVDETTPPTFLVHSKDDGAVPIKNSEMFLKALKENEIPGELMVFETGGHGYGLGRGADHETSAWPKRCIEWFGEQGVLKPGE